MRKATTRIERQRQRGRPTFQQPRPQSFEAAARKDLPAHQIWTGLELLEDRLLLAVDLFGAFFDVSPEPLVAGNTFTIEYEIENGGSTDAGPFTVELYVSRDLMINVGIDRVLTQLEFDALAAGTSTGRVHLQLTLPPVDDSIWTGDSVYTIGLFADTEDDVPGETSEINNANLGDGIDLDRVQINSTATPMGMDLFGTFFDVTHDPLDAGETFNVAYEVTNWGEATTGPYEIAFYLSHDDTISIGRDRLLGTQFLNGLPGNSTTGTLPESLTLPGINDPFWSEDGTYYIGMFVDVNDDVPNEESETNNANGGNGFDLDPLTVNNTATSMGVDLFGVFFDITPEPLNGGQRFTTEYEIENGQPAGTDLFVVQWLISHDTTISPANDTVIGEEIVGGIPGNGTTGRLTKSLTLPAVGNSFWADDGVYTIGIFVDINDDVPSETNELNNFNLGNGFDLDSVQINNTLVPEGVDLFGTLFDVTSEPLNAGDTFKVEYEITNGGPSETDSFSIEFFLSGDEVVTIGVDHILGRQHHGGLAGNRSTGQRFVSLTLPPVDDAVWADDGEYTIGMFVDIDDDVTGEISELNNFNLGNGVDEDQIQINNTATPTGTDLRGRFFDVTSTSLNAGDTFNVWYQIENAGPAGAGPFTVAWYLSENDVVSIAADRELARQDLRSLAGNSNTGTLTRSLTLPPVDDPFWSDDHLYTIGMFVDVEDGVPSETSEVNNANRGQGLDFESVPISNTAIPMGTDLRGVAFEVTSGSINAGDRVNIQYRFENAGPTGTGPFAVGWYISANNFVNIAEDHELARQNFGSLAGNSNTGTFTRSLTLPPIDDPFWSGDHAYTIAMFLDINDDVPSEVSEVNNANRGAGIDLETVQVNNTFTPVGTDLRGAFFDVTSASLSAGDSFNVQYQFENTGPTGTAPYTVAWYLSSDNTINLAEDRELARQHFRTLAGNSNTSIFTRSLTLPPIDDPFWSGDHPYTIGMFVDVDNDVPDETSEVNNANRDQGLDLETLQVNNTASPTGIDLQGVFFNVTSASLNAGDTFNVRYRIENTGPTEALPHTVGWYISGNSIINVAEDRELARQNFGALPGNSNTDTLSRSLTLPPIDDPFWSGDHPYTIGMFVDVDNDVPDETSEVNNANRSQGLDLETLQVNNTASPAGTDLRGAFFDVTSTLLSAGETFNLQYRIENTGPTEALPHAIAWYISGNDIINVAEDRELARQQFGALAGNSNTGTLSQSLTLPPVGDPFWSGDHLYTIGMYVDVNDDMPNETSEVNNASRGQSLDLETLPINNTASPVGTDLRGTLFEVTPEPLNGGDTFNLEYQIENAGPTAAGPFLVEWYLSGDDTISPAKDRSLGRQLIIGVAGQESTGRMTKAVTLPPIDDSFWSGDRSYHIGMFVDIDNNVTGETSEVNNANRGLGIDLDEVQINNTITVTGVDLHGDFFTVIEQPLTAGASFDVTYEIRNSGSVDAGPFLTQWYLSANESIDPQSDWVLGRQLLIGVAGQSTTGRLTKALALPPTDDPFWSGDGTYHIGMFVDVDDNVGDETDENNNRNVGDGFDRDAVQISNTRIPGIDLVGNFTQVTQQPLGANDSFDIEYEIRNGGTLDAGPFLVQWYLSTDGVIDRSQDKILGRQVLAGVSGLSTTARLSKSLTLPLANDPFWAGNGTYTIGMFIDIDDNVPNELDETNNANVGDGFDLDQVPVSLIELIVADVNGDQSVNNLDITPLIRALAIGGSVDDHASLTRFTAQFPNGKFAAADTNEDRFVNNLDITRFIEILGLASAVAAGPTGNHDDGTASVDIIKTAPPWRSLTAREATRAAGSQSGRAKQIYGRSAPTPTDIMLAIGILNTGHREWDGSRYVSGSEHSWYGNL